MIFRGIDGSGDWHFGRGKQDYLIENEAIAKNLETKIKEFKSECFFAPTDGVPWFNLLSQKDTNIILLTLRDQIMNAYGVVKINDVIFSVDSNRKMTTTYNIDSIYSTGVIGGIGL